MTLNKSFCSSLLAVLWLAAGAAWAQDAAPVILSGYVLEKGSKDPVLGGSLFLQGQDGQSYSADTDLKGHYQVAVPPGDYQVVVAGEGFLKKTFNGFTMKGTTEKTYYLERDGFTLPEVVVSTDKVPPTQVSHESLSKEELTSVAGTGEDVLKAVQALPGVVTAGSINGELFVRGNGPADNLYFVDTMPIGYPYHFGIISVLDSNLVQDLDFFAGGFGPEYLNAQGGLVDITMAEPRTDRWGFRADVNMLMSEVDAQGPLTSNTSLEFSYRRSYLDVFVKDFTSSDGDFSVPVFSDYQVKFNYTPAPKVKWDLEALGSHDVDNGSLSASATVAQQDPALAGAFGITDGFDSQGFHFTDDSDSQNLFSNSLYHMTASFDLGLGQGLYDNRTWDIFGEKFAWTRVFNDESQLKLGAEYDEEYTTVSAFFPVLPTEGVPNFNFTLAPNVNEQAVAAAGDGAVYADEQLKLLDKKLELNLGARLDYLTYDSTFILAPRLSAAYHLTSDTTLKGSYGFYFGPPNELSAEQDYIDPKLGNPNLTPEQCVASVVGVEQKLNDSGTLFRVEAYEKDLTYVIVSDTNTNYSNNGSGYARGVEFFLRQPPTEQFYGWIAYAVSDSERRNGPGQSLYNYDYDVPNVLTVVGTYKISPGWTAGFKWSYNTGLPYSPVSSASQASTVVNGQPVTFYTANYGPVNSARYPDYSRVDFETSFKTVYDTWEWRLYFDIINALNNKNVLGYSYSPDYKTSTVQYDLPFLPFIGLEVTY